jgi:hypothetical protein
MLPGKLPNLALLSQAILVIAAANAQPADKEAQPANQVPQDRRQLQASVDYSYGGVPRIFSRPPDVGRNVAWMVILAPQYYYLPWLGGGYRSRDGRMHWIPLYSDCYGCWWLWSRL